MADAPPFPPEEFARRRAALQGEMAARGEDALLLSGAADICYVTGFLTRFWESPARPFFVVVPRRGEAVAVIPQIGRELMAGCAVGAVRCWEAPDPSDEGVSLLAETLAALVPERGRIAVPMGAETRLGMPLTDYARLCDRLAPRLFVDGTETVRRVREVKSEAEIGCIRAACVAADAAFDRMPEIVQGAPDTGEVARRFQIALLEAGADWVSYVAAGAGPAGYGSVIAPGGARRLGRGDVVMLDTGAVRGGYFCDIDRNVAIGEASDELRRGYGALHDGTEAALGALRCGMTGRQAHGLIAAALRAAGAVPAAGRLGHGLGLALTEWPSFSAKDETVLREGMVLTIEPGIVLPSGGLLVQEEDVVLGADGPELLSRRAPGDLPVVPV